MNENFVRKMLRSDDTQEVHMALAFLETSEEHISDFLDDLISVYSAFKSDTEMPFIASQAIHIFKLASESSAEELENFRDKLPDYSDEENRLAGHRLLLIDYNLGITPDAFSNVHNLGFSNDEEINLFQRIESLRVQGPPEDIEELVHAGLSHKDPFIVNHTIEAMRQFPEETISVALNGLVDIHLDSTSNPQTQWNYAAAISRCASKIEGNPTLANKICETYEMCYPQLADWSVYHMQTAIMHIMQDLEFDYLPSWAEEISKQRDALGPRINDTLKAQTFYVLYSQTEGELKADLLSQAEKHSSKIVQTVAEAFKNSEKTGLPSDDIVPSRNHE